MIPRLSQTLSTKIKAGNLTHMPLDESPYADGSYHHFTVDRTRFILLSNPSSLYSCVMFGKGISEDTRFIERPFVRSKKRPLTISRKWPFSGGGGLAIWPPQPFGIKGLRKQPFSSLPPIWPPCIGLTGHVF